MFHITFYQILLTIYYIHEKVHDIRFKAFMANKCTVGAHHKANQSAQTSAVPMPIGSGVASDSE
jgi:hypothetical protein